MTTGNAEQLGELLSAYVDGELDERDSQRAASILRQDADARRLYAELKRTRELVQTLPRHAAPASIAVDVLARLERSALIPEGETPAPVVRRSRGWWKAPLSMAAVLAICAFGWWGLSINQGERSMFSRVDSPVTPGGMFADGRARTSESAETVEKKLAAGVKLAALRQHSFANEPVRLQLVVDSDRERDEVARRISRQLAAASLPDLASETSKKEGEAKDNAYAEVSPAAATFFYQGKAGVNFADATSQQILVRAAPGQVQTVLSEVDRAASRDDQLALQAGPLSMRGQNAIDALELFAESASAPPSRAKSAIGSKERLAPAGEHVTDARQKDDEAARFVRELLKTAGIDPAKVASADGSRAEPAARRGGTSGDVVAMNQPAPATAAAEMNAAKPEAVGASAASTVDTGADGHLTFVLEIVSKPKSPAPADRAPERRANTRRNNNSRSDSGRTDPIVPS